MTTDLVTLPGTTMAAAQRQVGEQCDSPNEAVRRRTAVDDTMQDLKSSRAGGLKRFEQRLRLHSRRQRSDDQSGRDSTILVNRAHLAVAARKVRRRIAISGCN